MMNVKKIASRESSRKKLSTNLILKLLIKNDRYIKFFVTLVLFIAVGMVLSCPPSVASNNYYSDYYEKYAQELLENKDLESALVQFCRVLIVKPDHVEAKKQIKTLLKETDLKISRLQKLEYLRFVDIVDYTEFLRQRIKSQNSNSSRIIKEINQLPSPSPEAKQQILSLNSQYKKLLANDTFYLPSGDMDNQKYVFDMNYEISKLNQIKDKLIHGLEKAQAMNAELRNFRAELAGQIQQNQKKAYDERINRQIKNIISQVDEKNLIINGQQAKFKNLNSNFQELQVDFFELQKKLDETNNRIGKLTHDLADMSLNLFEKEKVIADKEGRIRNLEDELNESKERMGLVQRIIQDKDVHIGSLEDEIANVKTQLEQTAKIQKRQSVQLSADANQRIVDLERKFQELSLHYLKVDETLKRERILISQLEQRLNVKNRAILVLRKGLKAKEGTLKTLDGVVEIYRSKLHDSYDVIAQKSNTIKKLKNEISELRRNLTMEGTFNKNDESQIKIQNFDLWEPDRVLMNTYNNVEHLNSQVNSIPKMGAFNE